MEELMSIYFLYITHLIYTEKAGLLNGLFLNKAKSWRPSRHTHTYLIT